MKHAAEAAAVALRVDSVSRLMARGRTIVLTYHNVVPLGQVATGDRSLHLAQDSFARQLDMLQRTHEIVSLESAVSAVAGGRPRAAITFDDAYVGALTAGVEELLRRGLPATVFVAPAILGGTTMWWDAFSDSETGGLSAQFRHAVLSELGGSDARVQSEAIRRGMQPAAMPAWARIATTEQLMSVAGNPGITLGSHSWSHPNLAIIQGDALAMELRRPLEWLRSCGAPMTNWLAYPYGLATPDTAAAARAAGYAGALTVTRGWFQSGASGVEQFLQPRYNVPSGLSLNAFRLRSAGRGWP